MLRDLRAEELNALFREATAAAAEDALRHGVTVVGTDEQGRLQEITAESKSKNFQRAT